MKPGFALVLSREGIGLLQRAEDGWLAVDEVDLDDPAFNDKLADMRHFATHLAATDDGSFSTKIIIPNSEILYEDVLISSYITGDYEASVRTALDGRTPYALDELAYDFVVTDGLAQVAVVARDTLSEAEDFALEHGFSPLCFAAIPAPGVFTGEPVFGTSRTAASILPDGQGLDRDTHPVTVSGTADLSGIPPRQINIVPEPVETAQEEPAFEETPQDEELPSDTLATPEVETPEPEDAPAPEKPSFRDALVSSSTARPDATKIQPEEVPFTSVRSGLRAVPPVPEAAEIAAAPIPPIAPPLEPRRQRISLPIAAAAAVATLLLGIGAGILMRGGEDLPVADTTPAVPVETPATEAPETVVVELQRPDAPLDSVEAPLQPLADDAVQEIESSDEIPDFAVAAADLPGPSLAGDLPLVTPPPETTASFELTPFDALPSAEESAEGIEAEVADTATEPLTLPAIQPSGVRPELPESEALFARSGVWQRSPDTSDAPVSSADSGVYLTSLDPTVALSDPFSLPDHATTGSRPVTPLPPVGPAALAARAEEPVDEDAPQEEFASGGPGPEFAEIRPRARPSDLAERRERALYGGRTRSELAALRPEPRPDSEQFLATRELATVVTEQAVTASPRPAGRPADFAPRIAAVPEASETPSAAQQSAAAAVAAAPAPTRQPTVSSGGSVARQATLRNAFNPGKLNLIGVYGTSNSRRALVRLPSGRYVKVKVGDRVDGGRVSAIGRDSMQYSRSGRNITLSVP